MYQYSIQTLLKVKSWFDNNPNGIVNIPNMFPVLQLNKEQWHQWFIECLNNKINRFDTRSNYRKFDLDYFYSMRRAQNLINSRCIIDWLPKDLKERFSYRLRCNMDLN